MKRILKIVLVPIAVVAIYLIIGVAVNSIFPEKQPDLNGYFKPGDHLVSRFEGFDQTVLAVDGEWLHTRLEVAPNAGGPPEHFHEHFAETFTVKSGTLSILVDGEKKTLKAGESITIPPMTRHKPFNETNETVIVESDDPKTIPVKFAYILSQLYGFMDTYPDGPPVPAMIMQLSTYGNEADSWLADGPSLGVQKAMRVALAPTARMMGYSSYYENYGPKPPRSVAKLVITQGRDIFLDGKQISVSELNKELRSLSEQGFVLWYHRENPSGDPSPEMAAVMLEVMNAIRTTGMPARMFLKRDFSE